MRRIRDGHGCRIDRDGERIDQRPGGIDGRDVNRIVARIDDIELAMRAHADELEQLQVDHASSPGSDR
jgi:hypothetical protein